MFDQIYAFVHEQLQTNNLLSGGVVLMAVGALGAFCRNIPGRIRRWLVRRAFLQFEIPIKDEAFWWFDEWLSQQAYSRKRARWLSVRTVRVKSDDDVDPDTVQPKSNAPPKVLLSPAPGIHWLFWRGHFMVVHRERKEAKQSKQGNSDTVAEQEFFNVSILTWRRSTVVRLLEEARDVVLPPNDTRIRVLSGHYNQWQLLGKRRPRPLESVILKDGQLENLVETLQKFLDSEAWYVERGIPYRLGVILYGPPGTGKSSTAAAVASHLKLDIATLNLNDAGCSDNHLRELLSTVPERCMVLIEDIDCAFDGRESKEKNRICAVTFSGLLNAIDGVASSEGRILFMTSNHADKLDPALTRPGRCDVKLLIDNADYTQALRVFDRFYPEAEPVLSHNFAKLVDGTISMAALQGHLLKYCNDPQAAIANFSEVFNKIRSINEPEASDPKPGESGTTGMGPEDSGSNDPTEAGTEAELGV